MGLENSIETTIKKSRLVGRRNQSSISLSDMYWTTQCWITQCRTTLSGPHFIPKPSETENKSGRTGSNRRQRRWQRRALPTELRPHGNDGKRDNRFPSSSLQNYSRSIRVLQDGVLYFFQIMEPSDRITPDIPAAGSSGDFGTEIGIVGVSSVPDEGELE